jgi:predicted MFS family arabinose efflux permease
MNPTSTAHRASLFSIPVIVAALGYFVDIYDLLLFTQIRIPSLQSLGLNDEDISRVGKSVLNFQMVGLLLGGIFWGILGDKKGRLSVLFGSILLYSLANIANGMVQTVPQYCICRFIAGIGLAGELGAGITLVSELLSKEQRGIATSMVAGIGLTGAVAAFFIKQYFDWRVCFYIGGGLGLLLLLLRVSVFESGMYKQLEGQKVAKGNFFSFFSNGKRFKKYILSILIGLPTWYVIGLLIAFSNDFGKDFQLQGKVDPAKAIMYAYIAISIGDILIGFVSQLLRSRKKALYIFYGITAFGLVLFFMQDGGSVNNMYAICALLGFGTGFWAIFVTMAAEQFGTNLRATAATTVPNMVRGSLPLVTILYEALKSSEGRVQAAAITGVIVMLIAVLSAVFTEETFGKDLNFLETE